MNIIWSNWIAQYRHGQCAECGEVLYEISVGSTDFGKTFYWTLENKKTSKDLVSRYDFKSKELVEWDVNRWLRTNPVLEEVSP